MIRLVWVCQKQRTSNRLSALSEQAEFIAGSRHSGRERIEVNVAGLVLRGRPCSVTAKNLRYLEQPLL